eukprot:9472868-Pyramimonas_sp.AAC.1
MVRRRGGSHRHPPRHSCELLPLLLLRMRATTWMPWRRGRDADASLRSPNATRTELSSRCRSMSVELLLLILLLLLLLLLLLTRTSGVLTDGSFRVAW